MGNITNYKGSNTTSSQNLYWARENMLGNGNVQSGKSFSYQYGADNLRYSKTVNGNAVLLGRRCFGRRKDGSKLYAVFVRCERNHRDDL